MKNLLTLLSLLTFSLTIFAQSKREIPSNFGTITCIIEQSVSYSSYKTGTDTLASWYNKTDEGDIFVFNDTSFCIKNANGDQYITSYIDTGRVKKDVENCYSHKKENYWQFNNQNGLVETEKDRGAFGFIVYIQTGIQFLVEVRPYDSKFDKLDANYDPRPGFYQGTSTIIVQQNGEPVWVFYCRNVNN